MHRRVLTTGKPTLERVYVLADLTMPQVTAGRLGGHIREHSGVQALHHLRDVTLREDVSRIRAGNAPPPWAACATPSSRSLAACLGGQLFRGARPMVFPKPCTLVDSIAVPASLDFNGTCRQILCRDKHAGILHRTQATAACYCRSQLQLWFPKLQVLSGRFLHRWKRFCISGLFPGGVINAATRVRAVRTPRHCPKGEMTWLLVP